MKRNTIVIQDFDITPAHRKSPSRVYSVRLTEGEVAYCLSRASTVSAFLKALVMAYVANDNSQKTSVPLSDKPVVNYKEPESKPVAAPNRRAVASFDPDAYEG